MRARGILCVHTFFLKTYEWKQSRCHSDMEGAISETLTLAEVVRDPYVAECSETALLAAAGCFVPRTKAVQTSLRDLSRVCGAKRAIDPARAREWRRLEWWLWWRRCVARMCH